VKDKMTPYYEQDGITIYHADCRDVLPSLPKVDLVLTDPPYGIETGIVADRPTKWQRKAGKTVSQWDKKIDSDLIFLIDGLNAEIIMSTKDEAREIVSALPTLKTREALIYSPQYLGEAKRITFKTFRTFDSMRTHQSRRG